jgi:hypothetical protein
MLLAKLCFIYIYLEFNVLPHRMVFLPGTFIGSLCILSLQIQIALCLVIIAEYIFMSMFTKLIILIEQFVK